METNGSPGGSVFSTDHWLSPEGTRTSADLGFKLFPPEVELIDSFLRHV